MTVNYNFDEIVDRMNTNSVRWDFNNEPLGYDDVIPMWIADMDFEELIELGEICIEHNVLVISDEIHSDLVFKGYRHTCFASISERFRENSIICTTPSKIFNLAGLQTSNVIILDRKLRDKCQTATLIHLKY